MRRIGEKMRFWRYWFGKKKKHSGLPMQGDVSVIFRALLEAEAALYGLKKATVDITSTALRGWRHGPLGRFTVTRNLATGSPATVAITQPAATLFTYTQERR